MKIIIVIYLASILVSIALACTKEQLFAQIDMVTKALDEAAPKIKTMMDNFGSVMNDKMKKAITRAHDDMIKFKTAKGEIKKKVESGSMSVDDGCAEAKKLTEAFAKDMMALKDGLQG